jgi:hypothetical protein
MTPIHFFLANFGMKLTSQSEPLSQIYSNPQGELSFVSLGLLEQMRHSIHQTSGGETSQSALQPTPKHQQRNKKSLNGSSNPASSVTLASPNIMKQPSKKKSSEPKKAEQNNKSLADRNFVETSNTAKKNTKSKAPVQNRRREHL